MATVLFSKPAFVMNDVQRGILESYIAQAFPGVSMGEFRQLCINVVLNNNPGAPPNVSSQLFLQHHITPEQLMQRLEDGEHPNVVSVNGNYVLVTDKYEGGIVVNDGQGNVTVLDTAALRAMIMVVFGVEEIDAYNVAIMSFGCTELNGPITAKIQYRRCVNATELAAGIENGYCKAVIDRHCAATSIPDPLDTPDLP